ncbi:hypothetical protein ACHAXT_000858 [Thalassiosira profunda]
MSSLRLAIKLSKQGGSSAASITDAREDSQTSSTSTASPGKRRKATAATNVTPPTPKDAAGTGCSLRSSIKRSLGEDGAGSIILSATPPVRGDAGGPTTSSPPPRAKLLPAVSDSSSSTVGDLGVGKKTCKQAAKSNNAIDAKDSFSTPKAVSPYASSISSQSLSSTCTDSAASLAGTRVKLALKADVGGMQPTLQNPNQARQSPMLYLGIALERPETVDSWGLVFSKEKTSSALVVRVNTPNEGEAGPRANWSRITQSGPNPALICRTAATSMPPEEYEACLVKQFPPTCKDQRVQGAGILEPRLSPGDAIISINGISVSSFPTMEAFAAYIRQNCQRKVVFVAMRHEYVWAAACAQQVSQSEMGSSTNTTDRVATAVRAAWRVLASAGRSHKRKAPSAAKRPKVVYTNAMFKDEHGKPIPYCDTDDHYDTHEEGRLRNFINDEIETSFHEWLKKRKATWRESRPTMHNACMDEVEGIEDCEGELTVQHDFWLANGHESFEQWLQTSKTNWSRSYTWHKERLEALQSECEKDVHLPTVAPALHQFENWLGARKQQWRLERRKRQRQRVETSDLSIEEYLAGSVAEDCSPSDPGTSSATATNVYMDEILDKERDDLAAAKAETIHPIDISWVFDSALGAPDDIIVNVMTYLRPSDHGNLLCLSYTSNFLFKQREDMWKTLCPKHWILPRRPRKSWCAMYITKIRAEEEATRKRSDDLLVKANAIIEKADQLNKLEKLIRKAEKDFDFDVKYTSGVVLERNSLLNLAVIEGRHKITKWLIEEKKADIESCDRGQFTPLMNAAWNGDKYLVRYLLGRGCDRTKVGYNHSSEGLAPATFEGLTAEGWARKRRHDEVAELIKLGL